MPTKLPWGISCQHANYTHTVINQYSITPILRYILINCISL